jgi:hypothetical protein
MSDSPIVWTFNGRPNRDAAEVTNLSERVRMSQRESTDLCSRGRCVPDRPVMLADTDQQTGRPTCARICARDMAGQAETGETPKARAEFSCRRSPEPSAVTRDGPRRQRPPSYGS